MNCSAHRVPDHRGGRGVHCGAHVVPAFQTGIFSSQQAAEGLTLDRETVARLARQKEFQLETEDYKRPRAPAPSKLLEPWYRARSFTICHNDKLTDELFSRDIVERLRQDFTFLLPYYDYFVTLEGDPGSPGCCPGLILQKEGDQR